MQHSIHSHCSGVAGYKLDLKGMSHSHSSGVAGYELDLKGMQYLRESDLCYQRAGGCELD